MIRNMTGYCIEKHNVNVNVELVDAETYAHLQAVREGPPIQEFSIVKER